MKITLRQSWLTALVLAAAAPMTCLGAVLQGGVPVGGPVSGVSSVIGAINALPSLAAEQAELGPIGDMILKAGLPAAAPAPAALQGAVPIGDPASGVAPVVGAMNALPSLAAEQAELGPIGDMILKAGLPAATPTAKAVENRTPVQRGARRADKLATATAAALKAGSRSVEGPINDMPVTDSQPWRGARPRLLPPPLY